MVAHLPGSSSSVAAGTTSSPVETMLTCGRHVRLDRRDPGRSEQPEVGRAQRAARGDEQVARTGLLARTQHPVAGRDPAQQLHVTGIGSVVCSTITTASAPCGSSPPVGIVIAAPGPTSPSGVRPMTTAPVTSRNAGSVSDAA